MLKKYQWAIRIHGDTYVDERSGKSPGPGFLYTRNLAAAILFPTAEQAATRLDQRLDAGWAEFELVPVRVTEKTVTETITRVVGTKRSLD